MRKLLLFLFLISCGTSTINQKKEVNIFWPPPPDEPKIKFIEIISSSRDVEGKKEKSLKDVLLGIEPEKSSVFLERPMDIAINSKGEILVVDAKAKGIHIYDKKNKKFKLYGISGMGSLAWPNSIDVDENDNIYVSDHSKKKVFKYDSSGKFLLSFGNFENPVGVCVDNKNKRLLVVDSKKHNLNLFDFNGNLLKTIGERGIEEGQFNYPTYCDIDEKGNIYIVDTGNARVQIIDENFEVLGSFGSMGVHVGQFTRPKGIAVDKYGIVFVVDGAFNNVQMFNSELQFLMPFCEAGKEEGKLNLPVGIEIDKEGNIYIADFGNSRIQIFKALYKIY